MVLTRDGRLHVLLVETGMNIDGSVGQMIDEDRLVSAVIGRCEEIIWSPLSYFSSHYDKNLRYV